MARKPARARKAIPGGGAPPFARHPAALSGFPGADTSHERLAWRFCHLDQDGPWPLSGEAFQHLLPSLRSFEGMTVNELFTQAGRGKDYDVVKLPNPAAVKRLEELGLDDQTKISRLQVAGAPRLYGFRVGNAFHLVWWDREHEVWPSRLRHT
jgi:hypothetical protein